MACDYPLFHVSMAEYHNPLVLSNKLLGQTLRRIARANSHGKFCDPGIWGGDQGCIRSDQVEPVRVGQHPAIAGGGRS